MLPQRTPMKLKLWITQHNSLLCILCHSALQAFPVYLGGQQGTTGLSAEGITIIQSMLPHIASKRPESLDLKGLLGANTVTRMKFGKQSLRTLSDSHM